ncbi:MAG: crotonase/enoyl-CoA hydratase family protein [Gammaproteobacteria bacterium]|jgi:enoyl-CoA hydratase
MSVSTHRDGAVTTVVIERPQVRNAVDPVTARALYEAFVAFEADEKARVAVLTGAGEAFCAGFDLSAIARGAEHWLGELHFGIEDGSPPLGPMGPTRLDLSKPVIAAVNGAAVAGGMELALWCDFRIMDPDAYMGVFCRRWGVPLIDGGTVRLPGLVGQGRALELILTGRRVDAEECLRIGLCERLAEAGTVRQKAESVAREIARFPQACLKADRWSVRKQQGFGPDRALEEEFWNSLRVIKTEGIDGARRFAAGAGRHGDFGHRSDDGK